MSGVRAVPAGGPPVPALREVTCRVAAWLTNEARRAFEGRGRPIDTAQTRWVGDEWYQLFTFPRIPRPEEVW